ncbi:dTDP-4-dehydrorhamnose reductase [Ascidiimonas aurantiaca]|uniref:dTDP-4-dehydrorhamnose reductase n=1 Tax=Ascidiimonas aurantiaca TaxID=1685432 RepID=UPI0030EB84DE
MKKVLVTGSSGQLALCIKDAKSKYSDLNFTFADTDELNITKLAEVNDFFERNDVDYCINCAAYTAVDKAELEPKLANRVNEVGVRFLVENCKKYDVVFIHISTDFVFDGRKSRPYSELDKPRPLGVYGETKLLGERVAATYDKHFIIRTSWLYSEYGSNFFKTMLKLSKEREELNVVYDQIGTPTYARDLAEIILKIILDGSKKYGMYHYSNEGVASWYDFAKAIFDEAKIRIRLNPIKSEEYATLAKRPNYSILDKSKVKGMLDTGIPYWRDSLRKCLIKNVIY